MASSAPFLKLLFVTAILQLIPHTPGAVANAFALVDDEDIFTLDLGDIQEVMSDPKADDLSSAIIGAESKASAASAAYPEDMQVGDFSDAGWEDEEEVEGTARRVREAVMDPKFSTGGEVVTKSLDALVDFALEAFVHVIAKNNSSEMPIPDIFKPLLIDFGLFELDGHFNASRGTIGDLSSLFRDGDVEVRSKPHGSVDLEFTAGLRSVRVRFQDYSANAGPIPISGSFEAGMSPATVRVRLELSPPCGVALRSLGMASLGKLHLQMSGLFDFIQRDLEEDMEVGLARDIEQILSELVHNELNKFSCY